MPEPSRTAAPAGRARTRHALFAAGAIFALAMVGASPAAAASPAWSPIAVSGPTNLPPLRSETQRLGIDAEGGAFTLTAHHVVGRGIGTATQGFSNVGELLISEGSFSVGQTLAGPFVPAGTTITGCSPNCGAPTSLSVSEPFPITQAAMDVFAVDASATTAQLPFNAAAPAVESALNALSTIGGQAASVSVTGGPGGKAAANPYLITYGGSLANTRVAPLNADASSLTGTSRSATVVATTPGGPGEGFVAAYAQNVGGQATSGTTTLEVTLPEGVKTAFTPETGPGTATTVWSCSPLGAGQESFECATTAVAPPGDVLPPVNAPVVSGASAAGTKPVEVTVSGGGATESASFSMPLTVSSVPAEPGIQAFTAGAYDADGVLDTRAGGHPYSGSTAIFANTYRSHFGEIVPVGEFKDIEVDLPPGFLGNPIATPQCPEDELSTEADLNFDFCPRDTIVGRASPILQSFGSEAASSAVFNVEAPFGYPGKFYFVLLGTPIHAVGSLRSDGDYGLTVGSLSTAQIATVFGSFFTFWGTPADSTHDEQRCRHRDGCATASTAEKTALLSSPVNCAEEASIAASNGGLIPVALRITTWQSPLITHTAVGGVPPVTGCDQLHFDADFTFEPSDTRSDSPASFRTELTVPSEGLTDPDLLMTPTIKESVVELPKGVVLNASAADGLAACSEQQIGLKGTDFPAPNHIRFDKDPQTCPDASKIGSGELKSELIEEPLHGALYLAAQGEGNPFGSLFALYLVIEDPRHGIFIKLPGEVQVNEADGQQRIVFRDLPQLPFTYLRLSLKGGNRAPLASPTTCGNYVTTATNTPWSAPESGPPTASANGFEINQGPNGLPCAPTPQDRPFDIGLNAGTDSATAGAFSPLTFQITRPDGSQELDTLELSTAPGLVASLKGVPRCTASNAQIEAKTGRQELAGPSCPAASQVGRLETGVGSGPTPFYTGGKLYLAGPYKGAPLSVVAVAPAVAGPFDLGNVVVRTAVFINRSTAQVDAKADPIPQILKGVPLRIRDIRVILDRENFTLNPTSCEAGAIGAHATGASGASKDLSARFQVGGCGDLAFKPKFSAKVEGGTKRGKHPRFIANITWPEGPGFANTRDFQVTLPHSEFLDQAHIRTICTRVQALADACPAGSIYGFAEATTPLLDGKLSGPVFLKSSVHKLPDLAIKLRGPDAQPVEVEFAGRIDSVHGQIRNTIEGLPDVPVSRFTLKMKGGDRGLLINSRNLCATRKVRLDVRARGQNNAGSHLRPVLRNSCRKQRKHSRRRHESSRGRR